MINPAHALRHSKAADITIDDPAVAELWNQVTQRKGRVIVKDERVFVQVLDSDGIPVTQFERFKPAHGGVPGSIEYLHRQGYQ